MLKVILVLLILGNIFFTGFQDEIEFYPKSLQRDLDKAQVSGVKEMNILDSLSFQQESKGKFFWVSAPNLQNQITYIYVGRVNSCRAGGCSLNNEPVNTTFEYFDYYILYNDEGRVTRVKVFNYMATKGQEITARGWLKQFSGYDGKTNLRVGKEIDGISGATISVYAITGDVEKKTQLLQRWIKQEIGSMQK